MRRGVALLIAGLALAMAFFYVAAFAAHARINIGDIAGIGPNQYNLPGAKVNGSATKFVVDTLGWNATRIDGNVGIGDGSVALFDLWRPDEVDYPDDAFMCGDISMQPWTPVLKMPGNVTPAEANATENATEAGRLPEVNATGAEGPNNASQYRFQLADQGADTDVEMAPESPENAETEGVSPIYAAYHPIQYLRPVQDIMYEHPLATPGTAYCELLGFTTPSGVPVNVGMKCTGYGY
ncbi:MAG TPA: hypothetical protein VLT35_01575 [Methanocella sp.]|nr:hypothetical protein [Methanocella sp.]